MELNREQLFELAKATIKEREIDRITNLFGHLPIDMKAFYKCFPYGSEQFNQLIALTKQYERSDIQNL